MREPSQIVEPDDEHALPRRMDSALGIEPGADGRHPVIQRS